MEWWWQRNKRRKAELETLRQELADSKFKLAAAVAAQEAKQMGAPNSLDTEIAAITQQVAQNTSVEGSATTLINSIPTLIANAVAAATAAGATPAELQAITDLQTALANAAAPLAAAITANTPAS